MEQITQALTYWDITAFTLVKRYHENTERILCSIETDGRTYFLKGLPQEKTEETVKGNVQAHEHLGNREHMAPAILYTVDGRSYITVGDYWFYLMEYIEGSHLEETQADEYALGRLARQLHGVGDYTGLSGLKQDKARFYEWFAEKPFKPEFDAILDQLPDFSKHEQCFIHSDLGPHNAMRRSTGEVVLIDLDDAGIGSKYLDLGWAFIMQFVDFDHRTEEMRYRFDLALAFLQGYYEGEPLSRAEYDLIWQGAIYMHISYMQAYGPDAVDSLWKILQYGMARKEELWEKWCERSKQGTKDRR